MSQHKLGISSFGGQLAPGPSSASLAPHNTASYSHNSPTNGSSFVMGGSPMGRGYSPKKSSREEDRYGSGFGGDEVSSSKSISGYSERRGPSLVRSILGGRGEKIFIGLFFYALALIVISYCIVTMFGGSSDIEYYSRPAGFGENVRPLWDR
jgi:hypothetical protein